VEKAMSLASVTEVNLKDADKLDAGSVLLFKFGADPAMLIHHKDGQWVAFDSVCSHLGCTVQYHPDEQLIKCACHGGTYDPRTGANISGPPPKPLTKFKVKVSKGSVLVSRV
jgi:cytochrome b6-f complex iron-sulfur subunit